MVRQSLTGWRSAWRGATAGLLAGLVLAGVLATGILAPIYDGLQDQLYTGVENDPTVTLVAIDESSKATNAQTSEAWPWSNAVHAQVIENLARLHPKAILVDIVFNRSSGEQADGRLAAALEKAANVVIVCTADD